MEKQIKKTVKIALIFLGIGVLLGSLIVFAATPAATFYISSGVYPGAPSYTIWKEASNYFAKDANGYIEFSGTNISDIVNDAGAELTTGGKILMKTGVYSLDSSIILAANIVLEGEGWGNYPHDTSGTVLKKTDNFDMIVYNNSAGSMASTSFEIKNLMLFCDGATYSGKGIIIDNCKNFVIDHVLITRAQCAIHIKDSGVHWIINSQFIETYKDATNPYVIYEQTSSDWHIRGNDLGGATAHWRNVTGIRASGTGIISGNKIFVCQTGIEITGTCTITDNNVNDFYQYGISVVAQDSKVNDNFVFYIDAVTYNPKSDSVGILLKHTNITCNGNTVKDVDNEYYYGIYEWDAMDFNIILGNIVRGNTNGIRVVGGSTINQHNLS